MFLTSRLPRGKARALQARSTGGTCPRAAPRSAAVPGAAAGGARGGAARGGGRAGAASGREDGERAAGVPGQRRGGGSAEPPAARAGPAAQPASPALGPAAGQAAATSQRGGEAGPGARFPRSSLTAAPCPSRPPPATPPELRGARCPPLRDARSPPTPPRGCGLRGACCLPGRQDARSRSSLGPLFSRAAGRMIFPNSTGAKVQELLPQPLASNGFRHIQGLQFDSVPLSTPTLQMVPAPLPRAGFL